MENINIPLEIDPEKLSFVSDEECHASVLIFMRRAKMLFLSGLVTSDWLGSLESLFRKIPNEILNKCGYVKNRNSFERMRELMKNLEDEKIYELIMTIEEVEFTKHEELSFLKRQRWA